MKELWYFAHPYTVKDDDRNPIFPAEEANFNLACIRSAELLKRGYNIYSPISASHPIHVRDPDFLKKGEYRLWIELDNLILSKTDFKGIIMAPNWEKSNGCIDERNHFISKKLEVKIYNDIIKRKITY